MLSMVSQEICFVERREDPHEELSEESIAALEKKPKERTEKGDSARTALLLLTRKVADGKPSR